MRLRKTIGVMAVALLGMIFTQVDAGAHGVGGFHGGFGHGFFHGGMPMHGEHHDGHHDDHHGDHHDHHWAMHGFGGWGGHGAGGHFDHWQSGHWHTTVGFGAGPHSWSHVEGVWGH